MRKAIEEGVAAGLQAEELEQIRAAAKEEEALQETREESARLQAKAEDAHKKEQEALQFVKRKSLSLQEKEARQSVFAYFTGDEEVEAAKKEVDEASTAAARQSVNKEQSQRALEAAKRKLES